MFEIDGEWVKEAEVDESLRGLVGRYKAKIDHVSGDGLFWAVRRFAFAQHRACGRA